MDDASILRRYGIEPEPVIELHKKKVDRTLRRRNPRLRPEERFERLKALLNLAAELGPDWGEPSYGELEVLLDERERSGRA